jgi:hypothetical protein
MNFGTCGASGRCFVQEQDQETNRICYLAHLLCSDGYYYRYSCAQCKQYVWCPHAKVADPANYRYQPQVLNLLLLETQGGIGASFHRFINELHDTVIFQPLQDQLYGHKVNLWDPLRLTRMCIPFGHMEAVHFQ